MSIKTSQIQLTDDEHEMLEEAMRITGIKTKKDFMYDAIVAQINKILKKDKK